jgi:hypothetical protein
MALEVTPPLRRDVRAQLAKGDGRVVGRVTAIHNRLLEEGLAETARWYAEAGWL